MSVVVIFISALCTAIDNSLFWLRNLQHVGLQIATVKEEFQDASKGIANSLRAFPCVQKFAYCIKVKDSSNNKLVIAAPNFYAILDKKYEITAWLFCGYLTCKCN